MDRPGCPGMPSWPGIPRSPCKVRVGMVFTYRGLVFCSVQRFGLGGTNLGQLSIKKRKEAACIATSRKLFHNNKTLVPLVPTFGPEGPEIPGGPCNPRMPLRPWSPCEGLLTHLLITVNCQKNS